METIKKCKQTNKYHIFNLTAAVSTLSPLLSASQRMNTSEEVLPGKKPILRTAFSLILYWADTLLWTFFVDPFSGHFLRSNFVDKFCGLFWGLFRRHFLWTLFDIRCWNFLWTLHLDTFCGEFLRTRFVDIFCGHFLWKPFVDTFWGLFSGHILWTFLVDTVWHCGHIWVR